MEPYLIVTTASVSSSPAAASSPGVVVPVAAPRIVTPSSPSAPAHTHCTTAVGTEVGGLVEVHLVLRPHLTTPKRGGWGNGGTTSPSSPSVTVVA